MDEKDGIKVTEITAEVSEYRIKNTLKEYRSGLMVFNGALTALSFAVAFLTTWISIPKETLSQTITGWILFGLSVVLFIVSIGSLIRKKGGKGTEKWFWMNWRGRGIINGDSIAILRIRKQRRRVFVISAPFFLAHLCLWWLS